ncbi:MAG: hypothetical protein CMD67_03600 [Gammaproteobacteria bacterium]|nr:hypothetical protein [Gammaproteobacteria bacterium]
MKKVLLGTTAIAVAGFVVGSAATANAAEPISVGINGYWKSAMAMINEDNDDGNLSDARNSHALGSDVEMSLSGATTLDNGLTVGFNAQLEGGNDAAVSSGEAFDEAWFYFSGAFGELRMGKVESARQQAGVTFGGGAASNFGVNSPFFIFGNGGGNLFTRTNDDGIGNEDNVKLVYALPSFNGVNLAVSYAPNDAENQQYGGNTGDTAGALQNNLAVGANYTADFGGGSVTLRGGYEAYVLERCNASAATQTCNDNPESVNLGAAVSFGSVTIAADTLTTSQITQTTTGTDRERSDHHVGASYNMGATTISLGWGHSEVEQTNLTTDELDLYELAASYVLGPGIDVQAAIRSGEFDDETAGDNNDNSWTSILIGTSIGF